MLGLAFDMAKIGATSQDPSFKLSASDKGGFAFDIITSLSLGVIKKGSDLAGLGLKILEGSREISSATISLLGNSETFEVGLDNLAFQAMDELGLGRLSRMIKESKWPIHLFLMIMLFKILKRESERTTNMPVSLDLICKRPLNQSLAKSSLR